MDARMPLGFFRWLLRDYEKEKPVSDEMFQFFKKMYAYDKAPLNARIELEEESTDAIHQRITFDAAYHKERVIAHLYLPPFKRNKNSRCAKW
jgi:hypothetical protein